MFTVVSDISWFVKSQPDAKLQFQLLESFKLPEKFRFCVNE